MSALGTFELPGFIAGKFLLFMEKGERIKIEIFPANAVDVHRLFDYTVREKGYKNVSLILHAMAPMQFYHFKIPVYQWFSLMKCT